MSKIKENKPKKPFYKRVWFILLVVVVALFVIIGALGEGTSDENIAQNIDNETTTPATSNAVTTPVPDATSVPTNLTRDNSAAVLTTLFSGTFMVGQDIPPGRYVITADGSGNLFVNDGDLPRVNVILNNEVGFGVTSLTVYLYEGEEIEISRINNVIFTPAITESSTTLTAGDWIVGLDIPAGTYDATPTEEGFFGNFFVFDGALPSVNQILGGDIGVERVRVNLREGQRVQMHNIESVTFTQP